MLTFNPVEDATQIDPDRLRGMTLTVTFDDGSVASDVVAAAPPVGPVNRFTGVGLVDAAAAVQQAQRTAP
jgi:hypothetical protein